MIPTRRKTLLLSIFLSSFASLAFETSLIRIFSVSLGYHFAFMIISIAMLGIAASGTALSLFPRLREPSSIPLYGLLLGLCVAACYLLLNRIPFDPVRLSWEPGHALLLVLYYLVLAVPFFFTGMIVASAFSAQSDHAGVFYSADLLGAGTGAAGIILVMSFVAPEQAVFLFSAAALIAPLAGGRRFVRAAALLLIALDILLVVRHPQFIHPRMSPYKGLRLALSFPNAEHLKTYTNAFSRIDAFKSPAARFAPGLSLNYLEPLPDQIGLATDGGDITAVTSASPGERLRFLGHLPSALPYRTGRADDVLILDPKGGLPVLLAEAEGARNIVTVESNPLFRDVIAANYRAYSGNVFSRNSHAGLGRSWLRSSQEKFDIIDMMLMGAMPSGSSGIAEDYRFTVEAFVDYLQHLKPGGLLSMSLFIVPPPRTEFRLLNTIIAALEEIGAGRPEGHIAAIRSWGSICMLVKRTPLTAVEIGSIRQFAQDNGFDIIHHPGVREDETNIFTRMPNNEYFHAFRAILEKARSSSYTDRYIFDIRPVRDDNPFFHFFLKPGEILETYRATGRKWQFFLEEGTLLPALLVQVTILSLLLLALPAAVRPGGARQQGKSLRLFLFYFALLGLAYLLVEIYLVQRCILILEYPPYAFAAVLSSVLVSSGIGSFLSHRFAVMRKPPVLLAAACLGLFSGMSISWISGAVGHYPLPVKTMIVFLLTLPAGLFMGAPFPLGLRLLGSADNSLVPWAWAVNGCFSVAAPLMAALVAIFSGFRSVLWIGTGAYFLAFVMIIFFFQPHPPSGQRPRARSVPN